MDLYKYDLNYFYNNEISFSESCSYFYNDTLTNAITGNIDIEYIYEDQYLQVQTFGGDFDIQYYGNITFVCDLAEIEGVQGTSYIEYLDLFNRLTKEFDRIFFNSEETEIFALNGTLIDTTITTKHISYAMSITSVLMVFIGFISFFKWLFRIVGGR